MTTVDTEYNNPVHKLFNSEKKSQYRFVVLTDPKTFLRLDKPDRGRKGIGRLQKVRELFIRDNYLYAGFHLLDCNEGYSTNAYARIAKIISTEDAAI